KLQDYAAHQRFVDLPDLNGDGFPDILYGINRSNPGKEALLWLESEGDGEFAQPELLELGVYNVSIPVVADIDQDGRPDVILGSRGTDALVWVRNEGNGKYSQPNLIARRHNYDPGSIEVLDFNNDGWPDILAGSIQDDVTGPSLFSVYINNTDGTFSATPTFPTNYHIQRDLQMADMDGDGDLDMLWASPGYNSMPNGYAGWVPNNGDSWGDPVYIWEEVENVLDVHAADINGDGLNDVIVCKGDFPQIDYRINLGNAEFYDLHTISTDYARAMYAQVADINGDGLMDLIASADVTNGSGGADQISWWPGTGGGFFGSQQSIHIGGPAMEKFEIVDYDQDGVDDIITSGFQDFPMQWLKGHGDGNFEPPVAIPNSPIAVRGFQLVDMDDDGDLDMVGSAEVPPNGGTDRIVVSYNLANDVGVSGQVFFDGNANGQRDADEVLLNRFPIAVEPEALAVFSDDQGRFSVYGAEGTYNISPQLEDCWTLTTSPETYEINFSGIPVDSLEFGVSPNTNEPEASITLASAPTRCGFTVPFWLNYNNDGCWPFDGQAYLVLNELVEFVEATPSPAQVSGDTLFWDFTTLQPGESRSVALTMVIAGVEFLGTTIELPLGIVPYDVSGEALPAETFDFASVINCAYDPNDKQVYPARGQQPPFTENYTLFDEPLLYTIRFQNTGTDTAFNVVLRDQLSSHLDWETFVPGSSSHPYEATLYEDGRVEFYFRDILLPDSTTNEPKSHGFVQFEIEALPGLDEQTIIENTAGIYFDFNPPIITNTVENTMVSELPDFTPAAAFAFESSELQVVFTDVSSNDPTSWLWDLGDGNTSTAQHPEHLYATSGTYTVCLTAANDWGAHTTCEEITLISTSSIDLSFSKAIFVHPNPASEQVWIRSVSASVPQRLQLYNSTGQLIQTLTLNGKVMSVDVSGLATGQYWLRTESGEVLPLTIAR
ncbi:MAG: VCBS repeat-containing protein, partial [Mameliella sp.]|nr:VCBS repeat-containing protein [Phaeodactylibacter sp.]